MNWMLIIVLTFLAIYLVFGARGLARIFVSGMVGGILATALGGPNVLVIGILLGAAFGLYLLAPVGRLRRSTA